MNLITVEEMQKHYKDMPLEYCERAVKESRVNFIKYYLSVFSGSIYHNIDGFTVDYLDELLYATKHFTGISEERVGVVNNTTSIKK